MSHDGPFADLGTPGDLLRASLEALTRGGTFRQDAGVYDHRSRTLRLDAASGFDASTSVIGRADIGAGALISESVVWDGVAVGAGARLEGCIAARGLVPAGTRFRDALLWSADGGPATAFPL